MEHDRFKPPAKEATNTFESDDDDSSAKQKKQRAKDVARFLAAQNIDKPQAVNAPPKEERSIWQKLTGQSAEEDKPRELNDEADQDKTDEAIDKNDQLEADRPVDELSEQEQIVTAEAYVEERLHELADEELTAAERDENMSEAHNAAVAFLATLRERLARAADGEVSVEDAIESSYEEVVGASRPTFGTEAPIEFTHEATIPLSENPANTPLPPRTPRRSTPDPEDQRRRHLETDAGAMGSEVLSAGSNANAVGERTIPVDEAMYFERRAQQRGLLVGGIVGYLIGRRRGRIKTEKRMARVQQKLEKQVVEVQEQVVRKEAELERTVNSHRRETYATERAYRAEQLNEARHRAASQEAQIGSPQTVVEYAAATTAVAAKPSIERQGRVSASAHGIAAERALTINTAVAEMSRQELLNESANIRVGESNLRRVYDARLVDESGLRRLVQEYKAGHDMRRVLAREFLIKELRFERDPQLRQAVLNDPAGMKGSGASRQSATQQSSDSSSVNLPGVSPGTANTPAGSSTRRSRQTSVSPAILALLTFLTIALALYALWLTATR